MTKTLTEQWREGTLPEDCYYILTKNGQIKKERTCFYSHTDEQCFCFTSNKDIEEVIAPVPSYEAWQESQKKRALWFVEKAKIRNRLENKIKLLEEQLNYALETMGQIAKLSDNTVDSVQCACTICLIEERLKEIKGVK